MEECPQNLTQKEKPLTIFANKYNNYRRICSLLKSIVTFHLKNPIWREWNCFWIYQLAYSNGISVLKNSAACICIEVKCLKDCNNGYMFIDHPWTPSFIFILKLNKSKRTLKIFHKLSPISPGIKRFTGIILFDVLGHSCLSKDYKL